MIHFLSCLFARAKIQTSHSFILLLFAYSYKNHLETWKDSNFSSFILLLFAYSYKNHSETFIALVSITTSRSFIPLLFAFFFLTMNHLQKIIALVLIILFPFSFNHRTLIQDQRFSNSSIVLIAFLFTFSPALIYSRLRQCKTHQCCGLFLRHSRRALMGEICVCVCVCVRERERERERER